MDERGRGGKRMTLNKSKGNMFRFVTHTWNPLGGQCPHECSYCYAKLDEMDAPVLKNKYTGQPRIWATEQATNLGSGNTIFVQNMGDLFAKGVLSRVVMAVLNHCKRYPDNIYLFLSKDPIMMGAYIPDMPPNIILGTTIETDRSVTYDLQQISKAPGIEERYHCIRALSRAGYDVVISLEPLIDFNLEGLASMVIEVEPMMVAIGADSKGYTDLQEPAPDKVWALIKRLEQAGIKLEIKDNLRRLVEVAP
jgi:hypothetical protein